MKRIHADSNDVMADGVLPLTCRGSAESLAVLDEPLRDGEEVVLCDDELTVVATVFRLGDGTWAARADWKLVR